MSECPPIDQLKGLILGTLSQSLTDEMTEHIGDCEKCQANMQSIATSEMPVFELAAESLSAAPPKHSAYWKMKDKAKNRETLSGIGRNVDSTQKFEIKPPDEDAADGVSGISDGSDLLFLEPSQESNSIGRLQQFEIKRIIGRGGMGVVLEAFDTDLRRSVAIKVLSPKLQSDEVARERFCREGRAAASISHEHVVQMHQVSRPDDSKVAFLVMQLIEGETLEDRLFAKSALPPEEVAKIGMQIAAGLAAAHAEGLVHRDIKPANVLIEKATDRVKLTDFGLARVSDEVKLTQTGMLTGTVLYMSPEQALGEKLDERSDLFSLGAVLFEMATGASPFNAPTAVGVMKQIMDETPPAPHKLNPAIGKPTSDLIMQLLSKKRDQRPDSADAVARALASVVTEFGPISPLQVPAVPSAEVKKLSGTHSVASRTLSLGGWVISAILVAGLAISMLTSGTDRYGSSRQFPSVLLDDNPGNVWAAEFTDNGESIIAGIGDGSVRLWDIERQEVVKSFQAHDGNVWNVKLHPTKDFVATAGDDALVKLWDSKTFELIHTWKADNTVRGLAFSPTDERVLIAGDRGGTIHVYDIQSGEEIKSHSHDGAILGVSFSHDGKLIASGGSDKIVRIFEAETFDQRQTLSGHPGPIYSVAFAQQGPLLASVGFKEDILVWNAETGENVQTFQSDNGDNWGVAFCQSQRYLATSGQGGTAQLWDVTAGSKITTLRGHSSAVHYVAIDSQNKRIATCSRDGSIRIWDISSLRE